METVDQIAAAILTIVGGILALAALTLHLKQGHDPKNTKDRFRWGLVLKKETKTK